MKDGDDVVTAAALTASRFGYAAGHGGAVAQAVQQQSKTKT